MRNLPAHFRRVLCLLLCSGLFAACGFDLRDDVDLTLNFAALVGPSDELHSPYVKGARFNIFLDDSSPSGRIGSAWTLESEAPAVFAISNVRVQEYEHDGKKRRYLQAAAAALEQGQAAVLVRDDRGAEVFRTSVEVLRPDRIELLAHGPLLLERPEDQAVTREVQVLTGGTATFLARYYSGERRLYGNGTLAVATPTDGSVTAQVRQTFIFEDRDWLSISALREGPSQVLLLAAGEPVSTVPVVGVAESALAKVQLSQSDRVTSGEPRDGQWEVVLAETLDRRGAPIYGVEFMWTYGSDPQLGAGDLYRYEFKRGMRRMLSARHGAMGANLMIEGKEGFVDSTNHLGCAMTRRAGSSSGTAVTLGVLAAALLLCRRRLRVAGQVRSRPFRGPSFGVLGASASDRGQPGGHSTR